ncbi:hypothetical protein pb186bvf_001860 [Paramecium bursaria]
MRGLFNQRCYQIDLIRQFIYHGLLCSRFFFYFKRFCQIGQALHKHFMNKGSRILIIFYIMIDSNIYLLFIDENQLIKGKKLQHKLQSIIKIKILVDYKTNTLDESDQQQNQLAQYLKMESSHNLLQCKQFRRDVIRELTVIDFTQLQKLHQLK